MKTNNSTTSPLAKTKTPLAQVIEQALATVTELPWFEGFHAGTHTANSGKTLTFSRDDLQQMVDNFVPGTVPFVISHPVADTPSYGFAKNIKLTDDNKLYLDGDNVNVEFAQSVLAGNYGRRSLGIQFTDAKGWFIDHVAFLGAQAPSLTLQPVGEYKFSTPECAPITFEFSIETQTANTLVRLMRSIRDYFLETEGDDVANKIIDKWDADWLKDEVIRHELQEHDSLNSHLTPLNYSLNTPLNQPTPNQDIPAEDDMSKFTQADIDAAVAQAKQDAQTSASAQFSQQKNADKKRIEELEAQAASLQFSQQVETHQRWISEQVSAGKLLPAQTQGMAEFMAHIGTNAEEESGKFAFSQGTGKDVKTVNQSPIEFMKAMIENGGKHSLLDDDITEGDAPITAQFASSSDLNTAVLAYQQKNNVSYSLALDAVTSAPVGGA